VVGFTVLFRSFLSLGMAFEMKSSGVLNWGNVAIASIFGILLSFLLIANPIFSGLSLVVLTALSFIFSGTASVLIAFDLRKIKKHPEKLSDELKSKIEEIQAEIEQQIK
jgi:uncharacterized membrane protein HdeD (DUF308 family)